jgi:hypothetical protein
MRNGKDADEERVRDAKTYPARFDIETSGRSPDNDTFPFPPPGLPEAPALCPSDRFGNPFVQS